MSIVSILYLALFSWLVVVSAADDTVELSDRSSHGSNGFGNQLNGPVTGTALIRYPVPQKVSGAVGAHDPTVIKVNGTYYLYATAPGISVKTSTDRVYWTGRGKVFPRGLPWCAPYVKSDANIWAPEITHTGGTFYLYYACSSFGSHNSAIFLATSKTGLPGSFTHKGKVVETTTWDSSNAIDPSLLIDGDSWTLNYGSFGLGILSIAVEAGTGMPLPGAKPKLLAQRTFAKTVVNSVTRTIYTTAIEGATRFKRGNWYYLFSSFGACCRGRRSTYRIMVGRSRSLEGPYVDHQGRSLLESGGSLVLPSHKTGGVEVHGPGAPDVFVDGDHHYLAYHYYDVNGVAVLGINKLKWTPTQWPYLGALLTDGKSSDDA